MNSVLNTFEVPGYWRRKVIYLFYFDATLVFKLISGSFSFTSESTFKTFSRYLFSSIIGIMFSLSKNKTLHSENKMPLESQNKCRPYTFFKAMNSFCLKIKDVLVLYYKIIL